MSLCSLSLVLLRSSRWSLPSTTTTARSLSGFSRMLDLGGAPSSLHDRTALRIKDASKNCHIQVVCFDFPVLTRAIDTATPDAATNRIGGNKSNLDPSVSLGQVQPNMSVIQQVASLLNVNFGEDSTISKKRTLKEEDDLSLLFETKRSNKDNAQSDTQQQEQQQSSSPVPLSSSTVTSMMMMNSDPRAKYAHKLSKKGMEGGISGVDLAKSQVDDALQRGDAAGHWAARKIALAEPVRGNQWMAQSGTGSLLQYLTKRSIKICLLPKPLVTKMDIQEGERMESFKRQLSDVVFDVLLKDGTVPSANLMSDLMNSLQCDPMHFLVVSDQDAYLRAAKDAGMVACQIRPLNARNGNVSPHYSVPSVPDVMDVINEINGISYKAIQS
jgi:hypothetical protein